MFVIASWRSHLSHCTECSALGHRIVSFKGVNQKYESPLVSKAVVECCFRGKRSLGAASLFIPDSRKPDFTFVKTVGVFKIVIKFFGFCIALFSVLPMIRWAYNSFSDYVSMGVFILAGDGDALYIGYNYLHHTWSPEPINIHVKVDGPFFARRSAVVHVVTVFSIVQDLRSIPRFLLFCGFALGPFKKTQI